MRAVAGVLIESRAVAVMVENPAVVRIERATEEDWAVLRSVRVAALSTDPDAFGSTYESEQAQPDAYWRHRLSSAAWFLAYDEEPVGVAACVPSPVGLDGLQLDAMWVSPQWRGRGVGQALVDAVTTWAASRGAVAVSLTVVDGNDYARRLYERLGFVSTGQREPRPRDPGRWRERLRLPLPGP